MQPTPSSPTGEPNPLRIAGIEFVEFSTPRPQALGHVLETLGFRPVARHRSREVLLYRQGGMNIVVNGHRAVGDTAAPDVTDAGPRIAALALRVHDAGAAWRQVLALGAWPVPVDVQPMELHIPGVHGVGTSRVYFVDRWRDEVPGAARHVDAFSIFDVDFIPIPTVERDVPPLAALHWFGLVQHVGRARSDDWSAYWSSLFGFVPLPPSTSQGILPGGRVLASPCGSFYLQLIEEGAGHDHTSEHWERLAFGAPDVPAAVKALRARGVEFVDTDALHPDARGALTLSPPGAPSFELVHHTSR